MAALAAQSRTSQENKALHHPMYGMSVALGFSHEGKTSIETGDDERTPWLANL
jgi:hypothetical protein